MGIVKAFSLLYVSDHAENYVNLRRGAFSTYCWCAHQMRRSLKNANIDFVVLTNNKDKLLLNCPWLAEVAIEEIICNTVVPHDVTFRSAHHKIDAIRHISTRQEDFCLLLDVDMLVSPALGFLRLLSLLGTTEAFCLDLTDDVSAAYGLSTVQADLRVLSQAKPVGWFGGEFILANPSFFSRLSIEIDTVWTRYCAIYRDLHHQGDEAVVSAALCKMIEKGHSIGLLKNGGVVCRWWNTLTAHLQPDLLSAVQAEFLHLPADKNFIAASAELRFDGKFLRRLYVAYVLLWMPLHFVRSIFRRSQFGKRLLSPPLLRSAI